MKGPNAEEELEGAKNAIQVLGCELEEVKTFTLPDDSKRAVLMIRRKKSFSGEFPRHGSKIAKSLYKRHNCKKTYRNIFLHH